ncbi:hypothetical protein BOTBODRAFT_337970 [Botryobasidium botryosum FD-172 SS1]|uniref:Uncharacterized protein n=1 Tax=Botryobasidium botryosum (strain FD-172 SS1) TaxID=930990 RepID=A0A067MIU8_BOTB1|nr:hypothetical protein BOTBODRAFT_337970 [Botryobasidium botryosum FD-172 SS1]
MNKMTLSQRLSVEALKTSSSPSKTSVIGDRRASRGSNQNIAPIHQVSSDILFVIFQYAKFDLDDFDASLCYVHQDVWKPFHFLSSISLVCRSWREFVRSCPTLWTLLPPPSSTPYIHLFLERSKTAPLAIGFFVTNKRVPHFPQYTTLLLPHLHRLKACMLGFEEPIRAEDAARFLCLTSAPQLELLELRCENRRPDWFLHPDGIKISQPLFAGHTPRLRSLALHGVHVPLSASIFTGLTSLILSHVVYTEPDSVYQLTRILKLSPHLTDLRFHYPQFPVIIPDEAHSCGAVNLPHLETLHVFFRRAEQLGPPHSLPHYHLPYLLPCGFGEPDLWRRFARVYSPTVGRPVEPSRPAQYRQARYFPLALYWTSPP